MGTNFIFQLWDLRASFKSLFTSMRLVTVGVPLIHKDVPAAKSGRVWPVSQ